MLMIGVLHILVRLIRVFVLMCARLSVYSRNVVPLCFVFLFCCVLCAPDGGAGVKDPDQNAADC